MMREKPKLQVTRNYDIFEMHPVNRDIQEKPVLVASLKAHGFMPSSPIQCVRNSTGKLRVIRGHSRLYYSQRLGLPVWYVVDESNTDLYNLEGDSSSRWSVSDFLTSRAKGGDVHCQRVIEFQRKHGLTIGSAISLLAGESAGSNNHMNAVKRGTFKVSADLGHAHAVADAIDHFKACGLAFVTRSAFVGAVSLALRVPELDVELLKHRVTLNPTIVQNRPTTKECLDELDGLYNYGGKSKRIPLAFRALEIARERHASFGGRRGRGGNSKPARSRRQR